MPINRIKQALDGYIQYKSDVNPRMPLKQWETAYSAASGDFLMFGNWWEFVRFLRSYGNNSPQSIFSISFLRSSRSRCAYT